MTDCLTDRELLDLVARRLGNEARARLIKHIGRCDDCRHLVAAAVRTENATGASNASAPQRPSGEVGTPPREVWTPPPIVDEFRIERPLGRGGMGTVYLGHDTRLGRPVALKFIADREPDPRLRELFIREGQALASINHPNVVTVYRTGQCEGHPYLVAEYIAGQCLQDRIPPLPWPEVAKIGLQLSRGLAAVHRQGIIHHDIKPSNVIIDETGEAKLVDFGLAEWALRTTVGSAIEDTALIAGTPHYMAPEVQQGIPASFASDIYSLGAVLYELCTGDLTRPRALSSQDLSAALGPSEGGDAAQAVIASRLRAVVGMDPELILVIERCLDPEPGQRFASGEALAEVFTRLASGYISPPLTPGNPYRGLEPFQAEHRGLFFGRDADIQEVLDRLRHQPAVLITGDSGVGKSSLCRAGLLPRIAQGELDARRSFICLGLVPGHRPLASLAAALSPFVGVVASELAAQLAQDPTQLGALLREACRGLQSVLLFVDQAEELLTISEATEASAFSIALGELRWLDASVRLLATVRGDFFTRLAALPGLGDEISRGWYLLRPLSSGDVREAIVGPARARGVVFESKELIDTLVASIAQSAGGLPLLQFALAELWQARDRERARITATSLEGLGGVAGALSRHADEVLDHLPQRQQQAAQRILLGLTTGEGARNRRREDELALDDEGLSALQSLVRGRLVFASQEQGSTVYELAHEALVTNWPKLREWQAMDTVGRVVLQRLTLGAREWLRLGKPTEELWSERQLAELAAIDPEQCRPDERDFINASKRAVRRKRYGRLMAILGMFLFAGGISGAARLKQRHERNVEILKHFATAQQLLDEARVHSEQADTKRTEAFVLFQRRDVSSPRPAQQERQDAWNKANRIWKGAVAQMDAADAAYAQAEAELQKAFASDPSNTEIRARLAETLYDRYLLLEKRPGQVGLREFEQRLAIVDGDNRRHRQLTAPARLHIDTAPTGTTVKIERYPDEQGQREQVPVPDTGNTATENTPIDKDLAPGAYLFTFYPIDRPAVRLPLVLEREDKWQLLIPLPDIVPTGYVYVPPGPYFFGDPDFETIRRFFRSPPQHREYMNTGYLIGKTEVRFGEWIEYLESLPLAAPARHLLDEVHLDAWGGVRLRQVAGQWEFAFFRPDGAAPVLLARDGQPVRYEKRTLHAEQDWRRFPVVGLSPEDIEGYLTWLDRSGHLPGARLCTEYEWERAARGADDRRYPTGDTLAPEAANYHDNHGVPSETYGLDEVGAHPGGASPFGLLDMAGNVWELVQPIAIEPGEVTIRGGSYAYNTDVLRATLREESRRNYRDVTIGFRVCASFEAH